MTVIVYIYNSFRDPLFAGNLLMYLQKASQEKSAVFHVITHEQKEFEISHIDKVELKRRLAETGIYWHPLKWHSGKLKLFFKSYDFLSGLFLIMQLRITKSAGWMITLGSVAGSFGFLISRMLRMELYAYQFEPHSDFLLETNQVKPSDINYRLLSRLESMTESSAEVISTGTDAMIERLSRKRKEDENIFKIPSAVNEELFRFDGVARMRVREKFSLGDKKVFLYAGKIGGLYYSEELFSLFSVLHENIDDSFFIILSTQDHQPLIDAFERKGIPGGSYLITRADHNDVPAYLSAADLGIVAIPPTPSQQFRSPIKVGEYLLCGLPFLTCAGVSEDDKIAVRDQVGIVVEDFSPGEIDRQLPAILKLITSNKESIVLRCRESGLNYRGFSKYYLVFDEILKRMQQMK